MVICRVNFLGDLVCLTSQTKNCRLPEFTNTKVGKFEISYDRDSFLASNCLSLPFGFSDALFDLGVSCYNCSHKSLNNAVRRGMRAELTTLTPNEPHMHSLAPDC